MEARVEVVVDASLLAGLARKKGMEGTRLRVMWRTKERERERKRKREREMEMYGLEGKWEKEELELVIGNLQDPRYF